MSKKIPAFPVTLQNGQAYGDHQEFDGMTLRDYFAAKAMQAIIAKSPFETTSVRNVKSKAELTSTGAYLYADAMLEARK